RWVQDDGLHLEEQRQALAEKGLPLGVLHGLGADGRALAQVMIDPEVDDLVELPHLRLPEADDLRVLLARGQRALEVAEPLAGLADLRPVRSELVDVPIARRRLER